MVWTFISDENSIYSPLRFYLAVIASIVRVVTIAGIEIRVGNIYIISISNESYMIR